MSHRVANPVKKQTLIVYPWTVSGRAQRAAADVRDFRLHFFRRASPDVSGEARDSAKLSASATGSAVKVDTNGANFETPRRRARASRNQPREVRRR